MALVVDTGVLFAAIHSRDANHERCARFLSSHREELVVPDPVLVELDYWIRHRSTVEALVKFAEDVASGGFTLYPIGPELLLRSSRLQAKYEDLGLGLVDASVFATCEELNENKVATLDRRHFSVLRTEDGHALEILPERD